MGVVTIETTGGDADGSFAAMIASASPDISDASVRSALRRRHRLTPRSVTSVRNLLFNNDVLWRYHVAAHAQQQWTPLLAPPPTTPNDGGARDIHDMAADAELSAERDSYAHRIGAIVEKRRAAVAALIEDAMWTLLTAWLDRMLIVGYDEDVAGGGAVRFTRLAARDGVVKYYGMVPHKIGTYESGCGVSDTLATVVAMRIMQSCCGAKAPSRHLIAIADQVLHDFADGGRFKARLDADAARDDSPLHVRARAAMLRSIKHYPRGDPTTEHCLPRDLPIEHVEVIDLNQRHLEVGIAQQFQVVVAPLSPPPTGTAEAPIKAVPLQQQA